MASQTPKSPAGKPTRPEAVDQSKKAGKKSFGYIGTIVVLGILIVAFIIVLPMSGSVGSMGAGHALTFGTYAGKTITYGQGTYFATQVQDINDQLRQQGLNESNYQFYAYQVYRGAFQRTVLRMAVLDATARAGVVVSDNLLDQKVTEYPGFQENGKFSMSRYQSASLSEKLDIRNNLRDDLLTQEYYGAVGNLGPSSKETAFVASIAKTTRTIEYVAFPLSAFPDTEVAAWASANAGLFRRLSLSRITLDTSQADAETLLKQIKDKSMSFDQAAKSKSKDSYAAKGGDEGVLYFNEIASDLSDKAAAEALASLKKGEYSPVLKTVTGSWIFFMANEDAQAPNFNDPAVMKDVRDYMGRYEKGKIEDWVVATATPLSKVPSAGFEAACKKQGLTLKTDGPFPLNYGDLQVSLYGQKVPIFKSVNSTDATELAGAATNDTFLSTVFSLAPGSVSTPIVLGDYVVVLKVKEAGSAPDDSSSAIGLYYPYFFQQKLSTDVADLFMKSPLLKDNFAPVFFKYLQPKQPAAGAN
ncbi:MAG TPA: SurA N-terminal domain-containing protein [Rectinemataceae bacterium]|nr:SurA N-terminal domain-containing protein [Rectinemataceae bacterium]